MTKSKRQKKQPHMPGTLVDRRPISKEQLARLERAQWEQSPEHYARITWARIKQMVEA